MDINIVETCNKIIQNVRFFDKNMLENGIQGTQAGLPLT
jgi:hypothetical protein